MVAHSTADTTAEIPFREPARTLSSTKAVDFLIPLCPLCGWRENRTAFYENACELRVCDYCDLFFVRSYPQVKQRHEELARGALAGIELLDCERRYKGERLYYDRHFSLIADACGGARSLLDVGCGTGHLLERLGARTDVRLTGIELHPRAAAFARHKAACSILEVPFEEFCSEERFDVITMINVFSHMPSFDRLFVALRNALSPNGKVVVRTSEMSRNVSRWNQLHWGIPDDLHFLGPRTLDFLCRKYGFVVERHVRVPYENELFLRSRWQQMGRRARINFVKRAGIHIPGALRAMRSAYRAALGKRLFVSFIVLKPGSEPVSTNRARRSK